MQYAEWTATRVHPARNAHLRSPAPSMPRAEVQASAPHKGAACAVACPLLWSCPVRWTDADHVMEGGTW